jgi:hypothetical protein
MLLMLAVLLVVLLLLLLLVVLVVLLLRVSLEVSAAPLPRLHLPEYTPRYRLGARTG